MADRWRVAVHEAGHYVAARLMGLPYGGASVVEPDPHAMFARDCGVHSVVALMAGAISEALVIGGYDSVGVTVWSRCSRYPQPPLDTHRKVRHTFSQSDISHTGHNG
jgi:hypothetical protein